MTNILNLVADYTDPHTLCKIYIAGGIDKEKYSILLNNPIFQEVYFHDYDNPVYAFDEETPVLYKPHLLYDEDSSEEENDGDFHTIIFMFLEGENVPLEKLLSKKNFSHKKEIVNELLEDYEPENSRYKTLDKYFNHE